jgi:hypothetical protein
MVDRYQVAGKSYGWFEGVSMNGIFLIISNLSLFMLSPSKDSERVFQQTTSRCMAHGITERLVDFIWQIVAVLFLVTPMMSE